MPPSSPVQLLLQSLAQFVATLTFSLALISGLTLVLAAMLILLALIMGTLYVLVMLHVMLFLLDRTGVGFSRVSFFLRFLVILLLLLNVIPHAPLWILIPVSPVLVLVDGVLADWARQLL